MHLAGYAAAGYTNAQSEDGSFNMANFNPIFHFLYKDLILIEGELEFEIEDDGKTETKLEYAALDLFINDYATLVVGKFLSPLGQFIQNIHPAWINKLPSRPPGFVDDAAAPEADIGAEIRGTFYIGNPTKLNYAIYIANGPVAEVEEEDSIKIIEEIEAEGFNKDEDGDKVFGGRLAVQPIPKLEIGASAAWGKIGLKEGSSFIETGRDYEAWGVDVAYQWEALDLRGEYIQQYISSKASSMVPQSAKWNAWYFQSAYKFFQSKWEGVARYGDYNSPHASQELMQWAFGVNYLFAPNVIAKCAYEINDGKNGTANDHNRFLLQLAFGF